MLNVYNMTTKHCIEKSNIICPECLQSNFIKLKGELICSKCGMVVNAPFPFVSGIKINVNFTIEPVKPKYIPSPVKQKKSNPVYRHNLRDNEIIRYNRKPQTINY